jgi:hypothetical protein
MFAELESMPALHQGTSRMKPPWDQKRSHHLRPWLQTTKSTHQRNNHENDRRFKDYETITFATRRITSCFPGVLIATILLVRK